MPLEPASKRVAAFVDGQNLFYAAKHAFGYRYPNYDVLALALRVCERQPDWVLDVIRFYTGIPDARDDADGHAFWARKLQVMSSRNVVTYSGGLRRRERKVRCPHGEEFVLPYRQEKGVDVRIALDAIHAARTNSADVLLIFSQDQDLAEVAVEVREIARAQRRWVKVASAFPVGAGTTNRRGIDRTDWIEINRDLYDRCIDPLDYRRHDLGRN